MTIPVSTVRACPVAAKKPPDPKSIAQAKRFEHARAELGWSEREAGAGMKNETQYALVIKSMQAGANPRTDTVDRIVQTFADEGYRVAWLRDGHGLPRGVDPPATSELQTLEALDLEREFLPKVEKRYPGLGKAAIAGLRAREKLRPYHLRTLWEGLADSRFQERGTVPSSLALINFVEGQVLNVGDPEDAPEPTPKKKKA